MRQHFKFVDPNSVVRLTSVSRNYVHKSDFLTEPVCTADMRPAFSVRCVVTRRLLAPFPNAFKQKEGFVNTGSTLTLRKYVTRKTQAHSQAQEGAL